MAHTDTSEYPGSHSLFCYTPDVDLPAKLQRIVDDIAEETSKPLGKTVVDMVASVARVLGSASQMIVSKKREEESSEEEEEDEGHSGDDYDAFDYDDLGEEQAEPDSLMAKLQQ